MKEKKDRVDDALHATKAALEEGIVPGGGIALLYSRKSLEDKMHDDTMSDSTKFGYKLVYDACGKPFKQILQNAGYSDSDANMISIVDLKNGKDFWTGYNIKECSTTNMKDAGIIDPFKVTRQALINAASIAGTILLTEAVIIDAPEDKEEQPMMDPSMMGMM